jgi:poly-gamma-glutamate synthesis protein (capsule biosynthesis protein)
MKAATIGIALAAAAALFAPRFVQDIFSVIPEVAHEPVTLFFTGDIMLARDVENHLERNGIAYPFEKIAALLEGPDATIGNFEGIVSEPHVQTPLFTFQFSVRPEYLKGLSDAGFDILSLANNHSSDYGDAAVALTKMLCREYELRCAGSSERSEAFVYEIRGTRIGFLFANMTWNTQRTEALVADMRVLQDVSDVQIAYVHWGTEYELVHNAEQEALAHGLIDAGADAVIGHHPHVVQDVGSYEGKPIFYSLGNFIFDQYWDTDVQTGLGVRMHIDEDSITYEAIPFTTADSHVQPEVMTDVDARTLFARIFGAGNAGSFTVIRH